MLQISSNQKLKAKATQVWLFVCALVVTLTTVAALFYQTHQENVASANSCSFIYNQFPSWLTTRLNENKSTYQQVANETGVPWEVLAAVHYREFNMRRDINPANHQGIYQMYSIYQSDVNYQRLAGANVTVTNANFLEQTRYAARFIQEKARSTTRTPIVTPRNMVANETDINLIKSTLFSYNGRASVYAAQAEQYGFNRTNQPFEGSPYVMNQFDCKRSAMGIITNDGGSSLNGTDTRMGAFTLYARLKGDNYWRNMQVENLPGCHAATNTTISCVWRLYNPGTKKYILTTSISERNNLVTSGYLYENIGFYGNNRIAPQPGNIPIYELRNGDNMLLTANRVEYDILRGAGWTDSGVAFYANPGYSNAGVTVYRLFNPATSSHVFTSDGTESKKLQSQGLVLEGPAFAAISTVRQERAAPEGQHLVYRFGNMPGNTHFWTTDVYERDAMIRAGYRYEGASWRVHAAKRTSTVEVYRLYSPTMRKHLYTKDASERDSLNNTSSWNYEGVAFYGGSDNSKSPLYRLYLTYNHAHFLTESAHERDELVRRGVAVYEGVAWYQP